MEFEYLAEIEKLEKRIDELKSLIGNAKVIFYGAGLIFQDVIQNYDISKLNIIGISDKKFKNEELNSEYLNYKVIPIDFIKKFNPDYIIVSIQEWEAVVKYLNNLFNDSNIKIIPLFNEYDKKYKLLNYVSKILKQKHYEIKNFDVEKQEVVFSNGDINILSDVQYPWIAGEVFATDIYNFKTDIDKTKKYSVLDIGANRCYASIYFAQKDWVKDVYAFELVENTAKFAQKNIDINLKYKNKIFLYPFGLGKEDKEITIETLPHRDGCNTIEQSFFDSYMPDERGKGIFQTCKIKKSSQIIKKIVEENKIENIIFKIDAEGAEYDILEDLRDNFPEIFNKIEILVGDTHLGFEKFYNILPENKFKIVYANKQEDGCCPFEIIKTNL